MTYSGNNRQLRHLITRILKSGLCTEIKKMNYVSSFIVNDDKKIVKNEEKILIMIWVEEKKEKLLELLKDNNMLILKD